VPTAPPPYVEGHRLLEGRTVVITAAAGTGIGSAVARRCIEEGATVLVSDAHERRLAEAVEELSELAGAPVASAACNVTVQDDIDGLFAAAVDQLGHIDVLINNAGVMPVGPFLEQSAQAIRSSIEVNLYGVLTGCQLVLPEMVKRRSGHIINIASLAGMVAVPGQAVYAATKFGVVGLSTALADEFAPRGVQITAVLPTFTNTELIAGTSPSSAQKPVEPAEIAAAIVKVLDKPKSRVSVPSWGKSFATVSTLLPDGARRWLSKKMGNDTVFLNLDNTARRSYEDRAQHATGVVEHKE